jgi:cation diffusion facilitator family transporter
MDSRNKAIVSASIVGMVGNAVLSALKIAIGVITGSIAVLSDGIDSLTDIATSFVSLLAARISSRPADARFPYGYQRAETIGTKALSFIMFFAGAQLIVNSVISLIEGGESQVPGVLAVVVTLISIVGKSMLAFYKISLGKKYDSAILRADGKNMFLDIVTSAVVLVGLGLALLTGFVFIDRIAAIIVSIWIIKNAFDIFMETNIELMDGSTSTEIYHAIISAVRTVPGAYNPHRLRARRVGNLWVIVMDVEVDPNISLRAAHEISKSIESAVSEQVGSVYDVNVHLEPLGNCEQNECFGISAEIVSGCQGDDE